MTNSSTALNWGLLGASDIAHTRMVPAINAQPGGRVVAVMSNDGQRARQFARDNAIPHAYDTVDALLDNPEVQAVYISSTNDRHKQQTLAAARAGRHVLCEKPLALSLADAREMVAACRQAGVVMGTNHHLRNAPTHRALRRLIAEGAIGQPLAARVFHAVSLPPRLQGWRINAPQAGGGVILDITVHDADTLRFVLNDDVVEVTALAARQGLATGDLEDAVMGVMRFTGGTLAQFHDAFTIGHAGTGFEVHGTEGSLFGQDVMTQEPGGRIILRRGEAMEEVLVSDREDLYIRSVRLFTGAAFGHGQPAATANDGLHSLAIALAVRQSVQTGQRVAVEPIS